MSSLRRILSLERTDSIPSSPLVSSRRTIARHSSLPILNIYKPQGLPSLPLFPSMFNGTSRHPISFSPPSFGLKPDHAPHKLASFRSVPVWSADDEVGSTGRVVTRPVSRNSRNESLDMEDSVVYKELCDSIQLLQVPCRYVRVLSSEGVSGLASHVGEFCEEEMKKERVELSSNDVRERPLSLRMLKKRVAPKPQVRVSSASLGTQQGMVMEGCTPPIVPSSMCEARGSLLCDVGGSVNSAFSSLVFMMESLQQHTLELRRVLMSEADARLHVMMAKVHQEMLDTFLWLFQKVFSCTPKLMFLTMMLLVDFAVHSMGEHVALAVLPMGEPPTGAIERVVTSKSTTFGCFDASSDGSGFSVAESLSMKLNTVQGNLVEPRLCEGGAGNGGARTVKVGGSMDGEVMRSTLADRAAMTVEDDTHGGFNDTSLCGCCPLLDDEGFFKPDAGSCNGSSDEHRMLTSMWQQAVSKEPNRRPLMKTGCMLIAPVQAPALEADDYPCFDRTDLKYQHELSRDPSNPLLLANYAQFLHVVRHDHDRAEVLYKRAVKADPVDGEVMGKYASFLWVAKEDEEGADEAYKAALAADPANAYHAGSYAHFLWNSSVTQDDTTTVATSYQQVSTT